MLTCSVALTTFNGEKYIIQQLESIMYQTVLPNEIIISDDGSTDKTIELVNSFINRYATSKTKITLIYNSHIKGVAGNFQNAIMHTSGSLIFLSDQDDIWEKDKIETVVYAFKEYPEAELFVHDATILLENERGFQLTNKHFYQLQSKMIGEVIRTDKIKKIDKAKCFNSVLAYNPINGMCMTVRREFIYKIMPFPKYTFHDPWISFCAMANDSFYAINKPLARYRIHKNNTSGIICVNKKKRKIISDLSDLLHKTEYSLRERYCWSHRVYDYLNHNVKDFDSDNIKYYQFMSEERLDILKLKKIKAFIKLTKAYKENKYYGEGKSLFIHDSIYLLLKIRKQRVKYIDTFMQG